MTPAFVLVGAALFVSPAVLGRDAPTRSRGGCPPRVEMPDEWPEAWEELEEDAVALINEARANGTACRGRRRRPVPALEIDDRLREAARRQTRYMALNGVWGHEVGGCDPFTWMEGAGYRGTSMGQNLGRRQGRNSARLAVSSWIASSKGHCEALMDPRWKALGVAYVRSGSIHLWTVDFGNR